LSYLRKQVSRKLQDEENGFPLEFTPAKAGAGMTRGRGNDRAERNNMTRAEMEQKKKGEKQ
jgi:hypothetical protein